MRRLAGVVVVAIAVIVPLVWGHGGSGDCGLPDCSDGQSSVERIVTAYLNRKQDTSSTTSTSCAEDHTLKVEGKTATVYRCITHGGQQDGVEVCVAFQTGRMLGEKQRSSVPISKLFCADQA
jgi:hypothetical protein